MEEYQRVFLERQGFWCGILRLPFFYHAYLPYHGFLGILPLGIPSY